MTPLLDLGLSVVCAGAGGFLGSYLKKKGENLATHEDINKLVDQVSAVTTATKEIEAKISGDVWDRQKRWELKRDALFDLTKKIAAVRDALFNMNITYTHRSDKGNETLIAEQMSESSQKCWVAESSFDQAALLVNLVCGEAVNRQLHIFAGIMRRSAKEISRQETDAANKSLKELWTQATIVTVAMRREIGIDKAE
jgi:hypothetical protein